MKKLIHWIKLHLKYKVTKEENGICFKGRKVKEIYAIYGIAE